MADAISEYEKLVQSLTKTGGIDAGQMFGKPCLKIRGKAFMAQHKESVIFKLAGQHHKKAMSIAGAALWDPSGKGRPMKEWVALPVDARAQFAALSRAALAYVSESAGDGSW